MVSGICEASKSCSVPLKDRAQLKIKWTETSATLGVTVLNSHCRESLSCCSMSNCSIQDALRTSLFMQHCIV